VTKRKRKNELSCLDKDAGAKMLVTVAGYQSHQQSASTQEVTPDADE